MIDGIQLTQCGESQSWVCLIGGFSDEFKQKIREKLTCICHGQIASVSGLGVHEYKKTLRVFLDRYHSKSVATKKGLIGELLAHLIIREYFSEFHVASPYFNQEEKSIRKGFDVVAYESETKKIWINEVKSGQQNEQQTADEKNKDLVRLAKNDLLERLNNNNTTLWYNAITSAQNSLEENSSKQAICLALDDIYTQVDQNNFGSDQSNVILTSVVFGNKGTLITKSNVKSISDNLNEQDFQSSILICMQKGAFDNIVEFLDSESTQ